MNFIEISKNEAQVGDFIFNKEFSDEKLEILEIPENYFCKVSKHHQEVFIAKLPDASKISKSPHLYSFYNIKDETVAIYRMNYSQRYFRKNEPELELI